MAQRLRRKTTITTPMANRHLYSQPWLWQWVLQYNRTALIMLGIAVFALGLNQLAAITNTTRK